MNQSLWLITYDIANPKRWRKVFRLLKSYGFSVQLSVFECRLSAAQQKKLWQDLEKLVHPLEDCVNAYPVCGTCESRLLILGAAKHEAALPDIWVVSDG
ncbi:MAG: CRISPR-associated endonuclease Cas2 [Flavobacteriaceae bacterium]|nr:MAG: CRISPR-associated endonuclease Cas2 [Flavobacteriaceae bacterium]